MLNITHYQFTWVHLLSHVQLFTTPWTAARQASLSITNSWSLPKLMSIESVMPSSYLILCHLLLLLPSILPSIRIISNESTLCMRQPKYWSFSFNISPSSQYGFGKFSFQHPVYVLFVMVCSIFWKIFLMNLTMRSRILQGWTFYTFPSPIIPW